MTTARDLLTVTMDMPSSRTVERGDLSLALAGAELADLLRAGAADVDRGRIVPGPRSPHDDRLLGEAATAMSRTLPFETVDDWLWRRGRGLPAAYLAALTDEGRLARQRERRWLVFGSSRMVLLDSADRQRAAHRWAAEEPVLVALATTIGVAGHRPEPAPPDTSVEARPDLRPHLPPELPSALPPDLAAELPDPAVEAVLSAVVHAVAELSEERRRRANRLKDAHATTLRRGY
ncbi:Golgi phosphoprotein 3 (GPP34) [Actinacidiphila yanglinensis]|uniref:Golgi phosphoprotein 3 (GPP34) n=1 Tax=Actinacidiphila yanglinensis TaxID=310779 RepID=A0A1H5XGE2_9ACTN|nr:GPP34 family phosphoprotein [Actinacidiphila yanglinensis]SEG10490.1 Golgi phosphoprotein 3 (GPP34) [Actinacidiphila yanglinensis]